MNNSDEPDQLEENECVLIQNAMTDATGYLEKRDGNEFVGDILTTITTPDFTGSGLDDLTTGGTYTDGDEEATTSYMVEIDGEGTPDTFKWSDDGGTTWDAETVSITGAAQTLNNGVEITFAATTGHTTGEKWEFEGKQATDPITGLSTLITDSGTTQELRVQTTKLEYNNSGTWTEIGTDELTTGLDTWFTQAGNKMYILNGTDNVFSYDGTTLTDMGNTDYPKGKYAAFWKNYLFICGDVVLNSTTYKNRVYFSDLGNPDTFTHASNWFDVGKSDGQPITGIAPLGEFLVIFKRRSIFVLSGSSPDEWVLSASVNNLSQIASGIGCVSAKSIVQVGNDLWFMSDDGVRSVKRNEQGSIPLMGIVSENMRETIEDINWSYADKIAGVYFDNKVYMAIPTGTSQTNDTIMVANTKIQLDKNFNPHPWFIYTGWAPYCWSVYLGGSTPALHYGDSSTTNVMNAESTNNDINSTDGIDMDVKGMMIDLKAPEMKKTARFIKYGVAGTGDYNLSLYTSLEGNTWTLEEELNLAQGNTWNSAVWGTDEWSFIEEIKQKTAIKIGSPQLMIRFKQTGNEQPVTLYPYMIAIKQRKIK